MKNLMKILSESLVILGFTASLSAAYMPNVVLSSSAYMPNVVCIKYDKDGHIIKCSKNNNLSLYDERQSVEIRGSDGKIIYYGAGGILKSPIAYSPELKKELNEYLSGEKTKEIEDKMTPLEKKVADNISGSIICNKYLINKKVMEANLLNKPGNIYINIDDKGTITNIFYIPKN